MYAVSLSTNAFIKLPSNGIAETFYNAITPLLFHTKALDQAGNRQHFSWWHSRTYYGSETLWHDYLVFRCHNETDKSVGRFVEIRDVAKALLQSRERHTDDHDLDLDKVLDGLCWLAMERGTVWPGMRKYWHDGGKPWPPDPSLNLLSAASYFGCMSLVRDLLEEGCDPTKHNDLFPPPMYLAAWTGRADVLQLIQEYLPDFEDADPGNIYANFRSKIGPPSLIGAAVRGDMDMVKLALYPPSRSLPSSDTAHDKIVEIGYRDASSTSVIGVEPGSVRDDTKLYDYISSGVHRARSPEIYQYLTSFLEPADAKEDLKTLNNELAERARRGDIVMVRYLLELGADPAAKGPPNGTALWQAIREFHTEVVDLLLERGANPREPGKRNRKPLVAAAKVGSMSMLRKLLDAGAVLSENPRDDNIMLRDAVKLEHTAMVEFLMNSGVATQKARRCVMEWAVKQELESMVELLRPWVMSGEKMSVLGEP